MPSRRVVRRANGRDAVASRRSVKIFCWHSATAQRNRRVHSLMRTSRPCDGRSAKARWYWLWIRAEMPLQVGQAAVFDIGRATSSSLSVSDSTRSITSPHGASENPRLMTAILLEMPLMVPSDCTNIESEPGIHADLMAQYDVHANAGRNRQSYPYFVIVQSARFDAARSRLVVPLSPVRGIAELSPVFRIEGQEVA